MTTEQILEEIFRLQKENPNNYVLGEEVRKLIKFCGLEWDSNCLNFFQNKRSVNTASVNQVRKNFYKSSLFRLQH